MDFNQRLEELLRGSNVTTNPTRQELIRAAVDRREAIVSAAGALATWTPSESTGICTVTVEWNTEVAERPFVELRRIDGFTWNP